MNESKTLCGDAYAPITSAMGFLRSPWESVAEGLAAWRRKIYGRAETSLLEGGLVANVKRLEPLTTAVRPRELIVATTDAEWTGIFDCGALGGDPVASVSYLARTMGVQGVVIVSIPDVPETSGCPERYGARQFQMFGPVPTNFINYVRTVSVVRDGKKWRFDANGTIQQFEDTEAYRRRKIADRLTGDMLEQYARELGLDPFNEDFFSGPSVLVANPSTPPSGAIVTSLQEAQRCAGIVPGC